MIVFPHAAIIAATATMRRNNENEMRGGDLNDAINKAAKEEPPRPLAAFETLNVLTSESGDS